jgi:hypothetical protein
MRPDRAPVGDDVVRVVAMVDSGAWTTCLPKQIAYRLGLTDAELVENPEAAYGVGSTFRTWSPTLPVWGRVWANLVQPDGTSEITLWGPDFQLYPAFTDHDSFLLGRADFFEAFVVTFEPGNPDPMFHLDYAEEAE